MIKFGPKIENTLIDVNALTSIDSMLEQIKNSFAEHMNTFLFERSNDRWSLEETTVRDMTPDPIKPKVLGAKKEGVLRAGGDENNALDIISGSSYWSAPYDCASRNLFKFEPLITNVIYTEDTLGANCWQQQTFDFGKPNSLSETSTVQTETEHNFLSSMYPHGFPCAHMGLEIGATINDVETITMDIYGSLTKMAAEAKILHARLEELEKMTIETLGIDDYYGNVADFIWGGRRSLDDLLEELEIEVVK